MVKKNRMFGEEEEDKLARDWKVTGGIRASESQRGAGVQVLRSGSYGTTPRYHRVRLSISVGLTYFELFI